MKYVDEYRDGRLARSLAAAIARAVDSSADYRFMEFCGGHTHAISRYGLEDLLPANVRMIHGPGCPVCVLPVGRIDAAIRLAERREVTLCTYGDLMRVPGSKGMTLLRAKAAGADEWETVKASRSIAELQAYTEKFQASVYYPYAHLRLTRLQAIASKKYERVLAEASSRALTPDEINALKCDRLWTVRNEIYFSLGFCFVSDRGINFFKTAKECPYHDCKAIQKFNALTYDIVSKDENDNIIEIKKREEKLGCGVPPVGGCARKE